LTADIGGFMRDQADIFRLAMLDFNDDDDKPRRVGAIDGRSVEGRRLSAARRAFVAEFGDDCDPLRLRVAIILHIGLTRLEQAVAKGSLEAITQASKISNTLMRLRRELAQSANANKTREYVDA
jgi:hypothetical protein